MLKRVKYFIVLVVVVAVIVTVYSKLQRKSDEATYPDQPKIQVAATIYPLYDMVRFIGGMNTEVRLLLPSGSSLQNIDSIYEDLDLSDSLAVFAIGHGLDTDNVPDGIADKIFVVDDGIDLLLEDGSTGNPFYWLSVKKSPQIAKNVADHLSQLDPDNAAAYAGRLEQFGNIIASLDKNISELLSQVPRNQIIVYGYDWAYFAEDYNLDIIYHTPIAAGDRLGADILAEMTEIMIEQSLSTIFTDIYTSPVAVLPLMTEQNSRTFSLDVLGGQEDRLSYVELMSYNARTIFDALSLQL